VNWLDLVFGLIMAASIVSGFMRGMLRIGIGFAATIFGFLCASWFYGSAGEMLRPYVTTRPVANFLGFLLIFASILAIGAVVSTILARIFRAVGLSWLDRLLGAGFGVLRGLLICVVIVMVLLAFSPAQTRDAVADSYLAPYVVESSRALAAMTPHEIKDGFHDGYEEVKKIWAEVFKKKSRKKEPASSAL
jgi:membrane protein required for colicin V production